MIYIPVMNDETKACFNAFSSSTRETLLFIRTLIFSTAEQDDRIGKVEEVLRWGQPSYITSKPKSGTTIRLGQSKTGRSALFVHCQTSLVSEFKAAFPSDFTYEGNRAVIINKLNDDNINSLKLMILRAFTYHERSSKTHSYQAIDKNK